MKRFLILPTLILAILSGCSEANENIGTNSGHYEDNASNVANTISKLSPGIYTINVFGKINSVTISNIKAAMINNPNAKISLDLSNTTGLLGIDNEAFMECNNLINIAIPNNATYIANHAFSHCNNLTNISIPSNVTYIGSNAFNKCNNLASVTFENTTEWYYSDNDNPDLILIDVTNKSNNAAYLRDIYLGSWHKETIITTTVNDIKNIIPKYPIGICTICINGEIDTIAFYNIKTVITNNYDTKITLDLSNTTGLTKIDYNMFSNCNNLIKIIIPNSVTSIYDEAFSECNSLTNIIIPNSITYIGNNAFNECNNLKSVTFENTNDWYHSDNEDYTDSILIDVTNKSNNAAYLRSIYPNYWYRKNIINTTTNDIKNAISELSAGLYTINTNGEITPVTIFNIKSAMINNPNAKISLDLSNTTGLQEIDNEAFSECYNLTNIILPNSITTIGDSAFHNCYNLKSIIIPYSVTSIGDSTFSDCSSLKSITIPNSVTSIGNYAFNECNKLTNVNYTGTEEQWNQINIGDTNEYLTTATINYEYTDK